ncbi:ArnT family glycosyltransferase [Denitratisoma oestradiolicum]|uniref:ArnT-like N-terminal domain-containing protein n=1 Tax=Denitratisoma oestradiolicum TaxID=311182 RepID=A0A6S6Y9I6_9PROT|nr:phospholipid carrier-dependent glycosyltransferase [Denitratisoma oestradiolicum]TWO82279.1 hypothetical protein CBW56_02220 [Denitratisoma oestradiolicum]CAB1369232.1 conserved membrane protein of unknown function [Denitratisoma oestradiolicum]
MTLGRLFPFFLLALLLLGWGIWEATGLTGKDEYLLGLRIPLEMMQRDAWWVPFIDGAPRLKKPPLLYWLGRLSYEGFGPSLVAARGITVAFALLLLGCTAWLGKRLGGSLGTGLLAAGVLLGMSGMASESRRLMLDVPVAALSISAFCLYLGWLDRRRPVLLLGAAVLISGALLTKGPIALVACGGGLLALWFTRPESRSALVRHWETHALALAAALALPLYWYLHVRQHYGAQLAAAARDELEARQLMALSPDAAIGILTLALPWSFIAFHGLWQRRHRAETRFLGLWLLFTLLPFFFIRSFERYLIGSLPALALLAALALKAGTVPAWTRRLGSLVPALLATALALLLWRWQLGGWLPLAIVLSVFLILWWRRECTPRGLIASTALLWAVAWGLAFPCLGVNAVPTSLVDLARQRPVILFAGPQPALLPLLSGRAQRQTSQMDRLAATDLTPGTLLTLRAEDRPQLDRQLQALGRSARPVMAFQTLSSAGSGIRFARQGTTRADWQLAWNGRSPIPLMSTIQVLEMAP